MKKLILTIFSVFLLSTASAHAASYYFASTTGSDSNLGTQASPWKTIGKANSLYLTAGDTLYFNGGETFNDTGLTIYESGTQGSPITVTSYGTGQAILDMSASTTLPAIQIFNAAYVTINNITASSSRADHTGSSLTGSIADLIHVTATSSTNTRYSGVTITNNTLIKGGGGIKFTSPKTSSDGYDDVVITGNTITDQRYQGIYFHEVDWANSFYHYNNPYIAYNTISGALGDDNNIAFGIVTGNATSGLIERNLVYEIGKEALRADAGPAGIFPIWALNMTIQKNVVHNVYRPANIDGAGIDNDFGNSGILVQYNYVYDTEGESYMSISPGAVFRFNIGVNGGTDGGIVFRDGYGGLDVYNNTLVCTGSPCLYVGSQTASEYHNNIFYTTGLISVYNDNPNASFEGNLYYGTGGTIFYQTAYYYSLADWKTATNYESTNGGFSSDPLLGQYTSVSISDVDNIETGLSAYAPQAGSDAIGNGLDLLSLFTINPGTVDIRGDTLGTPYNIGAFDEVASAAVIPFELTGNFIMSGNFILR